ncbi:MAG: TIGR00341 family protein [Alphaproteobacteria bacterium]|nr:MAG: TIGR00341 family protein [Alphaproteobacteria bacterium]
MSHRIIQIHIRKGSGDLARKIKLITAPIDIWPVGPDGLSYALLVRTQDTQNVTDRLQELFLKNQIIRIVLQPVEAILPKPAEKVRAEVPQAADPVQGGENGKKSKPAKTFSGISRDELYADVSRGAETSTSYILLVIFSTIVAGIGLIENNVAVVIGAMVIAPLLGPNLALALSTALGDLDLMAGALKTMVVGFLIALGLSFSLGLVWGHYWPDELNSPELLSRTVVGFGSIALALVSGAAAVLSLASGLSSVLVGVMVAVALLPPGATIGIMLGAARYDLAGGAALLLAVNIVCVNLSAKLVFLFKGVQPRTWFEKKKARRAMIFYIIFWLLSLSVLGYIIILRNV